MARVLVTGMSGTGKTTVLEALAARGYRTVDTDYGGWTLANGQWDEARMAALLAGHSTIAVSGTVQNQILFYPTFDAVVLLSAPVDALLERVRTRTNNPYGRTPEQETQIRGYARDVEPLLRRGATVELDALRPVEKLADAVEQLLRRCSTAPVYQLRPATEADVGFLTDVVVEATRAQRRLPPDLDELAFRAKFSQWTARQIADSAGTQATYVIEVDGAAVGRLRVVRAHDQIELAGIQLLPGQQSRGIGTQIITDLLGEASAAGLPMTLSVEKDNPRARALYRRLGFATTGETDKEFVMRRAAR